MKRISFVSILSFLVAAVFTTTSCEDMLTPELKRYTENYAGDSIYSAFGILKSIQKVGERSILLDAARGDQSTTSTYTTDSIKAIADFENPEDGLCALLNVADYYHIINSCNFYLSRVDTVSLKNNINEMLREAAAVEGIRAWAYIQLVNFYGEVPFVTEPMDDADEAARIQNDPNATKVNRTNLIDKLNESGFQRAVDRQAAWGIPNYGTAGAATKQMFFNNALLQAEAYLMRGTQADLEMAATLYHDQFNKNFNSSIKQNNDFAVDYAEYGRQQNENDKAFQHNAGDYIRNSFRSIRADENLSIIQSATTANDGIVLTAVQETFGFKATAYGSGLSLQADESYRQLVPSKSYETLSEAQNFNVFQNTNGVEVIKNVGLGDGRIAGVAPYTTFTRNGEKVRIIAKYCAPSTLLSEEPVMYGWSMMYSYTLLRASQIYLHYAEAINRLGFPEHAFMILKDGIYKQNIPTLGYRDENVYAYDTAWVYIDDEGNPLEEPIMGEISEIGVVVNGDTLYYEKDNAKPNPDLFNRPYIALPPEAATGGAYYLSAAELDSAKNKPYLDFSADFYNKAEADTKDFWGIHGRGSGNCGGRRDTTYTYAKVVGKKLAEIKARKEGLDVAAQQAYYESIVKGPDTLTVTDKELIIEAMEEVIIDESALELAYEGHRFIDLVRVAERKNANGQKGTEWLAWKIARRDYSVQDPVTLYDPVLYNKLLNKKLWYFALPEK